MYWQRFTFIVTALTLPLLSVQATIYKSTDKHGNTVFTDDPMPGTMIEPVDLKEPTIIPAIKTTPPPAPQEIAKPQDIKYTTLKITSPVNDSTIRNNGNVMLSASLQPSLHSEHQVQWKLDGNLLSQPGSALSYPLSNMDRGTHQAMVEVVNKSGNVLKSASVIFHVQRPSVLNQTEPSLPKGTPPPPQAPKAPQAPKIPQFPQTRNAP